MYKIIEEQLKKCKVAEIPSYDDNTTEIIILKSNGTKIKDDLLLDHYYKIEVEDYIIKPYDGFNLASNWNGGIIPKDKIMNCEIVQIMGKMVKVNAVGSDNNNFWSGWLPRKSFKVIEELN